MILTIVYLSYFPYGTAMLKSFIDSYKKFNPGINHKLVIAFNGFENYCQLELHKEIIKKNNINCILQYSKCKTDIEVYFEIAQNNISDYFLFLNTSSIILEDQYLYKYYKVFDENKDVGLVGATAGWGDFNHKKDYIKALNRLKNLNIKLNDIKKIIYFKYNFFPAVKPHIRTNAFMVHRKVFLELKYPVIKPFFLYYFRKYINFKLTGLAFEHGNESMSIQIQKKGYQCLIIDKNGLKYISDEWKNSKTFWFENQENLLISDNQTRNFQDANDFEKKQMSFAAWGS